MLIGSNTVPELRNNDQAYVFWCIPLQGTGFPIWSELLWNWAYLGWELS